jgi:hypothetical protein
MTTVDLYKKHKGGEVSREKFLYEVRRDAMLPFITNLTSYSDAVQILKNKGIIREESFPEEDPYNQGVAANKANKNYTDNPYSKEYEPEKYAHWTDGWIDQEGIKQAEDDEDTFRRETGLEEKEDEYNPDAAWQEGYDAFEIGKHQEENPYEGDTSEHKNWDMGYEKAQHDGPGLNEDAAANVEAVVNEYTPELLDALNRRKQDQEDVAAYREVESLIEKMAAELGCRTDVAFMEDEMFSGQYAAEDAIHYIKEMFISELNDMGLNEDPIADVVNKLDPELVKKAAEDMKRGNKTAMTAILASSGALKEGKEVTIDTVNPYEYRKGMQWELGYAMKPAPGWDENTASEEDFAKAGKKVLKNLSSDPNYYTTLMSNKGEKPKKVKEVKVEEDGMAKIKGVEKVTANVQTSLGKTEKGKKNPEGVKEMRGTRKTFSKIKLMKEGNLNDALDKNLRKLFK